MPERYCRSAATAGPARRGWSRARGGDCYGSDVDGGTLPVSVPPACGLHHGGGHPRCETGVPVVESSATLDWADIIERQHACQALGKHRAIFGAGEYSLHARLAWSLLGSVITLALGETV